MVNNFKLWNKDQTVKALNIESQPLLIIYRLCFPVWLYFSSKIKLNCYLKGESSQTIICWRDISTSFDISFTASYFYILLSNNSTLFTCECWWYLCSARCSYGNYWSLKGCTRLFLERDKYVIKWENCLARHQLVLRIGSSGN